MEQNQEETKRPNEYPTKMDKFLRNLAKALLFFWAANHVPKF